MLKAMWILFVVTIFLTPLVILPFTIDYYHPPKELFTQLAIIFCLALWLIHGLREAKLYIARTKFYFGLVLFSIISGLSLLWAKSRYLGLRDYLQFLTYVGAFFICVNIIDRHRKAVFLAEVAFAAGFISALYAVLQYFGFDFIRYPEASFPDWRFRLYSTFGNPDFLANYLILVFPLGIVFYAWTKEFFKKFLLFLALIIIYSALLVTFSIGAFLGLFSGFAFVVSLIVVERIRLKNLMAHEPPIPYIGRGMLTLIISLGIASSFFFVGNRFNPSSVLKQARSSVAWRYGLDNRLIAYRAAYKMVKDNPLLGVGIGNFKLRFPEYRGKVIAPQQKKFNSLILDKERDKHVHNELLQVWAETGIFGFIVFILIFLTVFKNGVFLYYDLLDHKNRLFVLGLLWSLSAFLVHSLFSFPVHITPCGLLFWVFVGLLFANIAKRDIAPIILNISPIQKKIFETGILILSLILCVWPISIYLSEIFLKRMVVLDKKGRLQDAFVEAKTSLFFDPNSNAVIYVGNYATLSQDFKTAMGSFIRALRNNDEINFHIALAEIYYKEGLPQDCINEYMRALLLNPSSLSTRLRLAELYAENQMHGEAETECQFILMNSEDEGIKEKVTQILKKIFDDRFLYTYYGELQINK